MKPRILLLLFYATVLAVAEERSCNSNICLNGGTCKVDVVLHNFRCDCTPGFTGTLCQDTCSLSCNNGHCAKDSAGLEICECEEGYYGKLCDLNGTITGKCSKNSDCKNGTKCLEDSHGDFVCMRDPCERNPCSNNGRCVVRKEDYQCECGLGYAGRNCESDRNECELGPCKNGGTCINTEGSFDCKCTDKYTGPTCKDRVAACTPNPCQHNGSCVESATSYHCLCMAVYTGQHCEILKPEPSDPCNSDPCRNGGQCSKFENTFQCDCLPAWTGPTCETKAECTVEGHQCENGGKCVRGLAVTVCECPNSYTGKWCETTSFRKWPDVCENVTCDNNGTCEPSTGLCNCGSGFDGEHCEIVLGDKNSCIVRGCQNDGECKEINESPGNHVCVCNEDFTGSFCEVSLLEPTSTSPKRLEELENITPPASVLKCSDCVNAKRCVELDIGSLCLCEDGYMGTTCSQLDKQCETVICPSTQICQSRHFLNQTSITKCSCSPGRSGDACVMQNTVSFTSQSLFVHQSPYVMIGSSSGPLPYALSFKFRSSVPDLHLVSGENIFGQRLFSIYMVAGRLVANVSETTYSELLPMSINDGTFYTVDMKKTEKDFLIRIEQDNFELFSKSVPRSGQFDIFSTRVGKISEGRYFVGCIADLVVDGTLIDVGANTRAVGVKYGCNREPQCEGTKCANRGKCIDLWTSYKCECVPPFLPDSCINFLDGSTFGHDNMPSIAELAVDAESARLLQDNTEIQWLMRTLKNDSAIIYIGDKNLDDVGTFMSAELKNGKIQVRARAGGKNVMEMSTSATISDNQNHVIRIERKQRHVAVFVDGILQEESTIPVRFNHPLFVEKITLGGADTTGADSFSTKEPYKGMLQDIRINDASVLLHKAPDFDLETIGSVIKIENVLQGLVSDDVCRNTSPCIKGMCVNTFNDYQCHCDEGWMGKDCDRKDHCHEKPCINGAVCSNTNGGGYICTSPVTMINTSFAEFDLSLRQAEPQTVLSSLNLCLKTFESNGQLLKMSAPPYNLALKDGMLVVSSNGASHVIKHIVSDGEWKNVSIRGKVVDVDGKKYGMPDVLELGSAITVSTVRFGSDGKSPGFEGSLDNVTIGDAVPLSFYRPEESGNPSTSDAKWQMKNWNKVARSLLEPDLCSVNPCKNGGRCQDKGKYFECKCAKGFDGHNCEININECSSKSCERGYCLDGINDYRCVCDPGIGGPQCEDSLDRCPEMPCANDGTCEEGDGTFTCECKDGWMGQKCDVVKTAYCKDEPCRNGGMCQQQSDGFVCNCKEHFTGDLCEEAVSHCAPHPCLNGVCASHEDGYTCDCEPGFTGTNCDSLVAFCDSAPCVHGRCEDIWNGTLCHCDKGWHGGDCSVDSNECLRMPCENDAVCVNTPGGYTCECRRFYLGDHCEIPGSCLANPCEHGECIQKRHDEHKCKCEKGYEGEKCEIQIDYCRSSPCRNGGTCEGLVGEYKCHCIPGFDGVDCEHDVDECAETPCKNGGICKDRVADYDCVCDETGYSGKNCSIDVDECAVSTNCQHGACSNTPGSYRCECELGFIGRRCSMRNPCLPDTLNRTYHSCVHGECVNPVVKMEHDRESTHHECKCIRGYTGAHCSQQVEEHRIAIGYVLGPLVVVLLVLCLLGCALFLFVMRGKRATHGHYSPSNQEISGARLQMSSIIKMPPEERLI